jgi:acyl-CoA thioesterase-1
MGMQIPAFLHSPMTNQFSAIFTTLANVNHMTLMPFFLEGVAGIKQLNLPDRIHPNAEGYKVIAANVWPVIEKLL